MRKLFLILTVNLLFLGCKSQDSDKIRVFVSWPGAEYLPSYAWKINEDKPSGVEPVLIERILSKAGYEYVFIKDYNPTKDGDVRIDVITDKEADVSIRSITINKNREEKVNFSVPYFYDGISAMVLDEDIKTTEDFDNKIVYAEVNTTAHDWAIKNLPNSKILNYNDFRSNTHPKDLMLQKKIDVFLGDRTLLMNIISENNEFIVLDETYTREAFGIAVDKDQPKLLRNINSALLALEQSGELEKLTSGFIK